MCNLIPFELKPYQAVLSNYRQPNCSVKQGKLTLKDVIKIFFSFIVVSSAIAGLYPRLHRWRLKKVPKTTGSICQLPSGLVNGTLQSRHNSGSSSGKWKRYKLASNLTSFKSYYYYQVQLFSAPT